ncbi:MAG: DUF1295 domain-containing protein [Gammaproteobacteria bacterium]|nr:DUF1295 domain-containing protein [Gammaproteobacteria bacterium]
MEALNLFDHPLRGTPFGLALDLCVLLAAAAWLLSVITREYSWVDRIWPICPAVYCILVAGASDFDSGRINLMTALVFLWGARLTFNYARKGGFSKGGEDYRWVVIRERAGPVGFQVLNIAFIAPGQMLLVWLFTSPIHQAWLWSATPLNWLDAIAAAVFLVLFIVEAIADEQMWRFQQDKKRRIAAGEDAVQPFITTGLFSYCRHPNYFCEIAMWWVIYLFAVTASGMWLHWTGLGCILLTLLFIMSVRLTESISVSKYPGYREYQDSTPALIPVPKIGRTKLLS